MFLDIDGCIIDLDLDLARDITGVIDSKLAEIYSLQERCDEPDGAGLCDAYDYASGMGFVALQRYLSATCSCLELEKTSENLRHGPLHSGGESIANIVNATANYWKHCDEWDMANLTTQQQRTADVVQTVTRINEYTCMDVLHNLTDTVRPNFEYVISNLESWREALREHLRR